MYKYVIQQLQLSLYKTTSEKARTSDSLYSLESAGLETALPCLMVLKKKTLFLCSLPLRLVDMKYLYSLY